MFRIKVTNNNKNYSIPAALNNAALVSYLSIQICVLIEKLFHSFTYVNQKKR